MPPDPITSQRLTLRPLREDDAPDLAALFAGDWDAVRQTGRMPWPMEAAAMRAWVRLHLGPGAYSYVLVGRADQAVMGMAGFGGDRREAELGYGLGRRYWNRGFASEAVAALLAHGPSSEFDLLHAYVFVENAASARVLMKTGFEDRGIIRRHYPVRGGMRRVHHFRMNLREERD